MNSYRMKKTLLISKNLGPYMSHIVRVLSPKTLDKVDYPKTLKTHDRIYMYCLTTIVRWKSTKTIIYIMNWGLWVLILYFICSEDKPNRNLPKYKSVPINALTLTSYSVRSDAKL